MNPQEAHQIANPEILKHINGCNTSSTKDGACFGREKGDLCDDCKLVLKGIMFAQEKEIEFLEECEMDAYNNFNEAMECGYEKEYIRLKALKISCEDLRKVLK